MGQKAQNLSIYSTIDERFWQCKLFAEKRVLNCCFLHKENSFRHVETENFLSRLFDLPEHEAREGNVEHAGADDLRVNAVLRIRPSGRLAREHFRHKDVKRLLGDLSHLREFF